MYFFDKKVEYLVWEMQEGYARGVGTVRFLVMDQVCRIEVVITGCGKVQGSYPVYLLSGDIKSLMGEITLNKGKGNVSFKEKSDTLGHSALPYSKVTGIHIDLKTEGFLTKKWLPVLEPVPRAKTAETQQETLPVKKERMKTPAVKAVPIEVPEAKAMPIEVPVTKSRPIEVPVAKTARVEEFATETVHVEASEAKNEAVRLAEVPVRQLEETYTFDKVVEIKKIEPVQEQEPEDVSPPKKEEFQLYPSKWKQLCAIYPIVHPFKDGRAYLSIEPRDFVILQERFQPMVQNSFLLHGFYHYRHLLLGRQKQGRSVQYYLGVPGVFYEKEKAAALFYGFESFEGASTPATEGSFGYYMKRVQI